ncbi:MAG: hypothetical protein ACI8T1_005297 [Verrucomicrobiales bacterium]|jgi:hypothetical protein
MMEPRHSQSSKELQILVVEDEALILQFVDATLSLSY